MRLGSPYASALAQVPFNAKKVLILVSGNTIEANVVEENVEERPDGYARYVKTENVNLPQGTVERIAVVNDDGLVFEYPYMKNVEEGEYSLKVDIVFFTTNVECYSTPSEGG